MGAYNNDGDACVRPRVMMCEYECEMGVRREGERGRERGREREREREREEQVGNGEGLGCFFSNLRVTIFSVADWTFKNSCCGERIN